MYNNEYLTQFKDKYKMNVINSYRFGIPDADKFKMTVSMSALETMVIPATGTNDFMIDWGDGSAIEHITTASPSHEYTSANTYQIKIYGTMPAFSFNNAGNKLNLLSVDQFGDVSLSDIVGFAYGCSNCTNIAGGLDTSSITSLINFVRLCSSLTALDVSGWDTSNVNSILGFALGCSSLTTLDVSSWNTSNITNMNSPFFNCSSLTALDVSSWNVSNVTSFNDAFYNCSSLTTLDVSSWIFRSASFILSRAFGNCSSLTTLDVSSWNLDFCTSISSLFIGCSSLTTLDVSLWNVSNITSFFSVFNGCTSLTSLNVSSWVTTSVTNISRFINNCDALTTIDISNWNTSNVTSMFAFAFSCNNLLTINVTGINTSSVTNISSFADSCINLTDILGFESINMTSCTNFSNMLNSSQITTSRYNAVLNQNTGWPSQTLQNGGGADMNFGNSQYSLSDADAVAGRGILGTTYNWNVIDGGGI